jgi:hypothetical protein
MIVTTMCKRAIKDIEAILKPDEEAILRHEYDKYITAQYESYTNSQLSFDEWWRVMADNTKDSKEGK